MAYGTFTVIIDGALIGGQAETTAKLRVAANTGTLKDDAGNKFKFPRPTQNISLPFNLVLDTDVAAGAGTNSTVVGYHIDVTTANGGRVSTDIAAMPADTIAYLTDVTELVLVPVPDAVQYRDQAIAARDAAVVAKVAAEAAAATAASNAEGAVTAAVTAAVAGLDLLNRTDPGVPRLLAFDPDYLEGFRDTTNRLVYGARLDGKFYAPQAVAKTVDYEPTDVTHLTPGRTFITPRYTGYLSGTVDPVTGAVLDDALGLDGQRPLSVLQRESARLAGVPPTANAWPMRIMLVFGQSNAGSADPLPAEVVTAPEDPRLFSLSADGASIVAGAGNNSAGAETARKLVAALPPATSLLVVHCAYGGSGFTTTGISPAPTGYHTPGEGASSVAGGTWDRNLTADPYNRAIQTRDRVTAARTLAPAGSLLEWAFWCQGEADRAYMTQAAYKAAVTDLFAWLLTAWATPTLPIVIGSMTPETIASGATSLAMDDNHIDLPRTVQRTAYTRGPAGMTEYDSGVIHYSSHGNKARVPGIVDALDRARKNVTTIDPSQPRNIKINRRAGGTVTITWDPAPGRTTTYGLQYRVAGGSWVTATLTAPLTQTYTIGSTVAATDTVGVQMNGTNEVGTTVWTLEEIS